MLLASYTIEHPGVINLARFEVLESAAYCISDCKIHANNNMLSGKFAIQ